MNESSPCPRDGEMGTRMRSHDWSSSPLGTPDTWPQSLHSVVGLMLGSKFPMFVAWGPELGFLYNDSYAEILGAKHPSALGRPFQEIWSEIWSDILPFVETALDGEAAWLEDLPLRMTRHGYDEDTFFTFSYSPAFDDDGQVVGMFCVCFETTAQVLAERRREALLQLDECTRAADEASDLSSAASELLGRALGASRVGYGVFDAEAGTVTVERNWSAKGFDDLAGVHSFSDYGSYLDDLRRGDAVANADVELDPRTAGNLDAMKAIGVRAFLDVPVVENGETVAQFFVHSDHPRHWTGGEIAFVRDFAERTRAAIARRQAEQELHQSEDNYRNTVELNPQTTWTALPDGRLDRVADRWREWTGGSGLGSSWGDAMHPDDLDRSVETWMRSVATGEPYDIEHRARMVSGEYRWMHSRAYPRRDGEGPIVKWYGSTEDIHDRKLAEEALRELNETLESQVAERTADRDRMWRLSTDLMLVARFDATITAVNPAWTTAFGWSWNDLDGRSFMDLVHPDDVIATLDAVGDLSDGRTILRFENRYMGSDGTYRWISWTAVPGSDLIHAVGRDVSVEKQAAEELERAHQALRQSQKMEAVGQLTGGLAHDFNNLLAGISGSLELLQTRIAQGRVAEVDKYIIGAQGAAKRAAALTHRLLAFSRRQTLDPKPTDVNRLVRDMQDLINRTVGPAIRIENVATAGLWPTLVDPNQLENALLNLCINARDAMPDGGVLTIETANRWLDERAARERDIPPGQYVSMCVSDNGTGMTPDIVARAFDPFFTTKPIGVGTGLGLSMIYGFARQSGGQVRIYSEVGQGTMVCIYLPRHHGAVEAEEEASGSEKTPAAQAGETVLVIDDEPLVRMLIVDVLEELGYTALEAGDGPEGIAVLRTEVRLDLLITDVGLPNGMNGRQVADAARQLRPELKVLFVTGYAENAVLSHGHLDPGMQVVTKPFDMAQLAQRIRSMVERNALDG